MPDIYNQCYVHYVDENGAECTSTFTTKDQLAGSAAAYAPLAAALQACSDAAIIAVQFQSTLHLTGSANDGPYKTIYDLAACMAHVEASNSPYRCSIVAPKADIFESDTKTLKVTDARVIEVSSQLVTLGGSSLGLTLLPIQYGNRQRSRGGP